MNAKIATSGMYRRISWAEHNLGTTFFYSIDYVWTRFLYRTV